MTETNNITAIKKELQEGRNIVRNFLFGVGVKFITVVSTDEKYQEMLERSLADLRKFANKGIRI